MKWPSRQVKLNALKAGLVDFSSSKRPLLGVNTANRVESLAMQMIASLRRLDYTNALLNRPIDPARCDPLSEKFDPERAAIWHYRNGNLDEAVWLIFLATHFGKNKRYGWRRLRDVYSGLGGGLWTWARVSSNVTAFRTWLEQNRNSVGGRFGNHRKYESLSGASNVGTGAAIDSYIQWIGPAHSHRTKFDTLIHAAGNNPHIIFDTFYVDMNVLRFGRLGKFDFLALLGRMGFAPITPGSAYLDGATGPLKGSKLLFFNTTADRTRAAILDSWLQELDTDLGVGMQVMEDSICNWQKSPDAFVHFTG